MIRSYGGKSKCRDADWNLVGYGNGEFYGKERGLVVSGGHYPNHLESVREALSKIDDINKLCCDGTLLDAV